MLYLISMAKEKWKGMNKNAGAGAVYGLGLLGALVYYLQHATTFSSGLIGVIKALLWPGFLVYRLFEFLGM
jgi:hypothetical protein